MSPQSVYSYKWHRRKGAPLNAHITVQQYGWGWQAGRKFTQGDFSFNEHRWRPLLALYRHLEQNLAAMDAVWEGGFEQWYEGNASIAQSYKELSQADRKRIAGHVCTLLAAREASDSDIVGADRKFPRKAGVLKVSPRY